MSMGLVYTTPPPGMRKVYGSAADRRPAALSEGTSFLLLDKTKMTIGHRATVTLSWHVLENVNILDWIGMYLLERKICFKYYNGITGCVRAVSSVLTVHLPPRGSSTSSSESSIPNISPILPHIHTPHSSLDIIATFVVTGMQCQHLKRNHLLQFQYSAKVFSQFCFYKTPKISDSSSPIWNDLNFAFPVKDEQELHFEIKERTWSSKSKLVARAKIHVSHLIAQQRQDGGLMSHQEYILNLMSPVGRVRSQINVGQLIISIQFIQGDIALLQHTNQGTPEEHANDSSPSPTREKGDTDMESLNIIEKDGSEMEHGADRHHPHTTEDEKDLSRSLGGSLKLGKNSDSGISQCSELSPSSAEMEPNTPSTSQPDKASTDLLRNESERIISLSRSHSRGGSRSTPQTPLRSPKLRRPERLRLPGSEWIHDGPSASATATFGQQHTALFLKNPCTLIPGDGERSSGHSGGHHDCQCRNGCRQKQLLQHLLPPNWEARIDRHGRVFFVDHITKTTSWEMPGIERNPSRKKSETAHRKQMSKRYTYLRRTVGSAAGSGKTEGEFGVWPAVLFLARTDFMSFLHENENAKEIYMSSTSVKHMVHRVRKDSQKFERYQHNKDFVALLNSFADTTQVIPPGWEMKADQNGRAFFVNHGARKTTFIDPRLPIPTERVRKRRTQSAPPPDSHLQNSAKYQEKVIQFLRSSGMWDILRTRLPKLAGDSKLKKKIKHICKCGLPALQKYSNDLDLIAVLRMTLRRDHLLKDSFQEIVGAQRRELQRCKLSITFDDEDGLDYGGPSREFFFLLSRELFNPYYGLFEYSANDTYTVQISPMSIFVEHYVEWFYFCGRVLGLALIHRYLIDTFFTRSFYKFLLKLPCSVSDLEGLDNQFHSSLQWIQDNSVQDLQLTFSVNEEIGGKVVERELKPGGAEIPVTEENKLDYIRHMCRWRLERGVKKQANSLLRGFYEVMDPSIVSIFDARELELVLSGTLEIDISDWRQNTEYRGGYSDSHVLIQWFWQAVDKFSNAQRLLLLQFVTGTSSVPYEGFAALRGSHGPKKFTIEKWGTPASLPRAHTCFNRIDLPPYTSFSILYQKLILAVEESSCYGIQ